MDGKLECQSSPSSQAYRTPRKYRPRTFSLLNKWHREKRKILIFPS